MAESKIPNTNAEQLITEHLDIWTTAIEQKSSSGRGSSKKFSLHGIKKLRELILELAVRGKLVPQDPNDEPALVLLERIADEKAQLVKDKKIKKPKALPAISEDEKPFGSPKGWSWVRFGDVCEIERGGSPRPIKSYITDDPSGINWIKIGDTEIGGKYITHSAEKIIPEGLKKSRKVFPGDFLLTNSMSFGRPYITNIEGCIHDGWLRISPPKAINKDYLYSLLSSPFIIRSFKESASGAVVMNLNADKVKETIIAIPPTEEQHRIAVKVDELMSLCDALEAQTENSITAHQTLVEVLLEALLKAPEQTATPEQTAEQFQQNWQRLSEHFDTLFTTTASIDTLKQTILQLAVMGKLVPQNPNDEPAAKLLERIAAEKNQLIKDKKIKKQKPLVDFEGLDDLKKKLPNSWEWIRLADTADLVRGGSPRPAGDPRFYGGNIPFLKVGDITRKTTKFVEGFNATITEAGLHKTRFIETRTVLLSNSGATLGIPAICTFPATFNDGVAAFVEKSQFIFDEYLYLYLSTLSKWFLNMASRGQGQPNLNTDIIKATWFALPPLEEQHRIVAKVDELMALCDQLKARLIDAQTTKLHLTDAIVEQAL